MRRFMVFGLVAAVVSVGAVSVSVASPGRPTVKHVLLISVDGMHQSDLEWYVAHHPSSELAKLVRGGAEFSNAHTSDPSDSDPGGTALMTGGDPRATGVYYDVEYSHSVFPPGTTDCSGPVPGGNVIYDSPDDKLNAVPDLLNNGSGTTFPSFDEGGSIYPNGVDTNPGAIMNLTPHPQSGLNPATFPVDPTTCQPIMPWDYLKVNTIFQVIHNAGMRTAWSDKHAIYASFNGPGSGGNEHRRLLRPGDRLAGGRAERRAVPERHRLGARSTPRPSSTTATRCRRSSTRSTATTTAAATRSASRRSSG